MPCPSPARWNSRQRTDLEKDLIVGGVHTKRLGYRDPVLPVHALG